MRKYFVAVCQMNSQENKTENLQTAAEMIAENASRGAKIIALPETMNYMGADISENAETIPGLTSDFLCEQAKKHQVWLVSGSFPEIANDLPEEKEGAGNVKPKNTLLLINPEGQIVCKYSKMHMFDICTADGRAFLESDTNTAGEEIVLAETPLGKLGFAICYDLRFPEQFRLLALHGAQIIFLPASFTKRTGQDHWETLIRTRAIENGVYIVAPNQVGRKYNMTAFGNSMIVDPWGNILSRAYDRPGSILAEIDLDYVDKIRRQIPSLENRRGDLYSLSGNVKEY